MNKPVNTRYSIPSKEIQETKAIYGMIGSIQHRNICYYYAADIVCPRGSTCGFYHISADYLLEKCPDVLFRVLREPKYIILTKKQSEVIRLQPEAISVSKYSPYREKLDGSFPILKAPMNSVCKDFLHDNCSNGQNCQLLHLDVISKVDKGIILNNLAEFAFVPVSRTPTIQQPVVKFVYEDEDGNRKINYVPIPKKHYPS